jgi:hypothetical protein
MNQIRLPTWHRCLSIPALLLSLASFGCTSEEPQILDVREVYGRTLEELQERWGEPDVFIRRSDDRATVQWKSVEGTRIYITVKEDGRARYVSYTFRGMDPFDESEAFRRIGLEPPGQEPEHAWENGAKRWISVGEYQKLVVNPVTKAITVGDQSAYADIETASADG